MSEQQIIEIEAGNFKTGFKPCKTRMEVFSIQSQLEALVQLRSSFVAVRNRIVGYDPPPVPEDETEREAYVAELSKFNVGDYISKLPADKQADTFDQVSEINEKYRVRSLRIINDLLSLLIGRAVSGDSPNDYGMAEVIEAATQFVAQQVLTEQERKNLSGGSDTSSPAHEARSPETVAETSTTPSPAKN